MIVKVETHIKVTKSSYDAESTGDARIGTQSGVCAKSSEQWRIG